MHRLAALAIALVPAALAATTALVPAPASVERPDAGSSGGALARVIVQESAPASAQAEELVAALGGDVTLPLPIVGGFAAAVPAAALGTLEASPAVASVTPDATVRLAGGGWGDAGPSDSDLADVADAVDADDAGRAGADGSGIDVALIDSGVVPVDGMGEVVHGPDLSFESQARGLAHLDTFGHGTHLAGIVNGRAGGNVRGVAPGARIVSVKVADAFGATDVSQVIAGIDWVVQHRNAYGLRIRVLALAFGTDSRQDYRIDPLAQAVEAAWSRGIVVVVSAGNAGSAGLTNPAYDPFVLAVGAADTSGVADAPEQEPAVEAAPQAEPQPETQVGDPEGPSTQPEPSNGEAAAEDPVAEEPPAEEPPAEEPAPENPPAAGSVPEWSSRGDGVRNPDVVAPGVAIVSLRAPGSLIDERFPAARVGEGGGYFRGSGTSQAAAVVAGIVALVLEERPWLRPNAVKALLVSTARPLAAPPEAQGAGLVDADAALAAPVPDTTRQPFAPSAGDGSLNEARGSARLTAPDGEELAGEQDIFGEEWHGREHALAAFLGLAWRDGFWNGSRWTGNGFDGDRWAVVPWQPPSWTDVAWTDLVWTSRRWGGESWSGDAWPESWGSRRWGADTWMATWPGAS